MTDNLVWVVDPEPHPGASRHPSERGGFVQRARQAHTGALRWTTMRLVDKKPPTAL